MGEPQTLQTVVVSEVAEPSGWELECDDCGRRLLGAEASLCSNCREGDPLPKRLCDSCFDKHWLAFHDRREVDTRINPDGRHQANLDSKRRPAS
jgi:hypothetical protein